jgi:hypothetical protein
LVEPEPDDLEDELVLPLVAGTEDLPALGVVRLGVVLVPAVAP